MPFTQVQHIHSGVNQQTASSDSELLRKESLKKWSAFLATKKKNRISAAKGSGDIGVPAPVPKKKKKITKNKGKKIAPYQMENDYVPPLSPVENQLFQQPCGYYYISNAPLVCCVSPVSAPPSAPPPPMTFEYSNSHQEEKPRPSLQLSLNLMDTYKKIAEDYGYSEKAFARFNHLAAADESLVNHHHNCRQSATSFYY